MDHSKLSASSSSSSEFSFSFPHSLYNDPLNYDQCPADELFYKGQLLPLQLSPRLSVVRTILLTSPSISSECDSIIASRDSSASTSSSIVHHCVAEPSSGRPSSAAKDVDKKHPFKLSSLFKRRDESSSDSSSSKISSYAKNILKKHMKKAKPLYEKLAPRSKNKSLGSLQSRSGSIYKGNTEKNRYLECDSLSSVEEFQSAILGAIAHCKNSLQ